MRHARQIPAQRRGGESTSSAWPSIVATTCSLSGAAAGLTTLALWNDPYHLRVGIGVAAAGAVYSSVVSMGRWRQKATRREELAEAREDVVAEMRFEIGRREGQIATLKLKVREAEETVVLFEQRAISEKARADSHETARMRAEHDLAVLTAWVHQTQAAADLTRSAVQSFQRVQSFEPAAPVANGYSYDERGSYGERDAYSASSRYDLSPAAAVPVAPVELVEEHAAPTTFEFVPGASVAPIYRPLRSAVLSQRTEVGFDVASDVNSAAQDPYLVPGVTMPRQRAEGGAEFVSAAASPSRPIAPERLYRPYLSSSDATPVAEVPDAVDLTAFDDTTQFSAVEHRRSGTA
jgi:hypothetical protein